MGRLYLTATTETVGVVMSTRWSIMLDTAVAEEPRLMFIISPRASSAIGLNNSFSIPITRSFARPDSKPRLS